MQRGHAPGDDELIAEGSKRVGSDLLEQVCRIVRQIGVEPIMAEDGQEADEWPAE